jgi:hypothetical protein
MTNKKTEKKDPKENKDSTKDVAPYLSKKDDHAEPEKKSNLLIPAILILVVAVVTVASFFENEYREIMADLGIDSTLVTGSDTDVSNDVAVTSTRETETPVAAVKTDTQVEKVTNTAVAVKPTTETTGSQKVATSNTHQPGLITVYNPYLRPYPQVYAPIPQQQFRAPYGMPSQQRQSHNERMAKHQQMLNDRHSKRLAVIKRMDQDRHDAYSKMQQRREEAQKIHAERMKKMYTRDAI